MYAICSRGDLIIDGENAKADAFGCYDTKVTSFLTGAKERKAQVINGPTSHYSGDGLGAFDWQKFPATNHDGLPQKYNFDFIPVAPKVFGMRKEISWPQLEALEI